ncbi:sensor histidine kinase [Halobaculum sp. EA56]|uniref:sensor histidine kinase n=1 Tax=Halobaculum sp. EA56 TaxID=3421648 RepID=UPI003EBF97E1
MSNEPVGSSGGPGSGAGTDANLTGPLRHLHAATRRMLAAESAEEVAAVATDAAEDVLGFDLNSVRLVEPSPPRLVPVAYSEAVVDAAGDRRDYPRGESVQWEALDAGECRAYRDVREIDDGVERSGEGSMLVCPLGDRGVLSLGTLETDAIDEADVALAKVLAANTEAALERAERERRLERKNERLDRFAGIVAHEFRNPVTIAAGHLDYVEGAEGDARHLDAVGRAVGRMDRLIDSLLDMVREGELTDATEPVSVAAVARSVWEENPAPGTLRCPDDVVVEAHPGRLRTVFENLFGNAVATGDPDATVTVSPLDDGDGFSVADDAAGFDAADPERLFEYGATADADATGLGLAIVRDVAEAHGWEVAATLDDDGGARIEFRTGSAREGGRHRWDVDRVVGDGRE